MFSLFRRKKPSATSGGDALLRLINGKEIAYCTERAPDESGTVVERVLGKIGRINVYNGIISVSCDGTSVFRCSTQGAECGELMSLAGVIIKGVDFDSDTTRTIVAYYQYYRK